MNNRLTNFLNWIKLKSQSLSPVFSKPLFLFGILALTIGLTLMLTLRFKGPKVLRLTRAPADSPYLYAAYDPGSGFAAFIAEKETNAPKIKANFAGGATAEFVLDDLSADLSRPRRFGNKVTFKDIRTDMDLNYQTLANGIKEEIILHAPVETNRFNFTLTTDGVRPNKVTETGYGTGFFDLDDRYLFHFTKPFAVDEAGSRTDAAYYLVQETEVPGTFEVSLFINNDWLQDPSRIYPIVIDPTIVYSTSTEFAAGQLNRAFDTGSGFAPNLTTYYQELSTDRHTLGLWHLNETGSTVTDSSLNGKNGTATGTTTTTGRLDNARSFTGGSNADYITITGDTTAYSNNIFTVEAWTYPTGGAGASRVIFDKRDAGSDGYILYLGSGNAFICTYNAISLSGVTVPALNSWSHVACTSDGTTLSLYVNGILDASVALTGNISVTASGTIGGRSFTKPAITWYGLLDEVRLSAIARSPEEIKLSANRRPYSTYISEVINFNSNTSGWNPFQWTELGVKTGDGETLQDATALVAQWNFNATSGTSAVNDAGSCSTSCDGTLTNFASTASQDQAPLTGWTSADKRWGAGALVFDGVNDYVTRATPGTLPSGATARTIEVWFNPRDNNPGGPLVHYGNGATAGQEFVVQMAVSSSVTYLFTDGVNASNNISLTGNEIPTPGDWHHLAFTLDGSNNWRYYLDGILKKSGTFAVAINTASPTILNLGTRTDAAQTYFPGSIDSTRIYSRALSANEVLSNYNAGNLEVQTRVGDDSTPDDGSWDPWSPTSGEAQIDSLDSSESTLVSYWPLNEYAGTTASDWVSTNTGTDTSTTFGDSIFGKTRAFSGSSYITIPDATNLDITGNFTLMAWVRRTSTIGNGYIVSKFTGTGGGGGYALLHGSGGEVYCRTDNGTTFVDSFTSTGYLLSTTGWHHLAIVKSGATCYVYIDGIDRTSTHRTHATTIAANAQPIRIGAATGSLTDSFVGNVANVRLFNSALTTAEVQKYVTGSTSSVTFMPTVDSLLKLEGSSSTSLLSQTNRLDANTVSLWHLDENGGTGAYLKDSTANANHATPSNATLANGISGKARSFNGTTSYASAGDSSVWDFGSGNFTIEAWVKRATTDTGDMIVGKDNSTAGTRQFFLDINTTGTVRISYFTSVDTQIYLDTTATILDTNWHYIVGQRSGNSFNIYIDGALSASGTTAGTHGAMQATTAELRLGIRQYSGSEYPFSGIIDEVRISNIARTYQEIADAYRLGHDQYFNKTIASTDLSGKTYLPFYIAGEKPGTYLSFTVGESDFANNQPDAGTLALLHMDEKSGSGAYAKDVSGNNYHGTVTGTTYVPGKLGQGRAFAGASTADYVTLADGANTSINTYTVDAWVYPTGGTTTNRFIFDKRDASGDGTYMLLNTSDVFACAYNATATSSPFLPELNTWYHVACTSNGSTLSLYVNGSLISSAAITGSIAVTTNGTIGGRSFTKPVGTFLGTIDEVRFSNVVRSADELRQAFEIGSRTHDVTIDFGGTLDAGNLITGSGDTSFTVDSSAYGLSSKGSHLYLGDKIIIKENYDGTEYLAQGTVNSVVTSTGATTVTSWDAGSTFPSGGFSVDATVFKWQREYFDLSGILSSHLNAVTKLSFRLSSGHESNHVWLDDLRSATSYLTTPAGSTLTSNTGKQYLQFKLINSSSDVAVSPSFTTVTSDFQSLAPDAVPQSPEGFSDTTSSITWSFSNDATNETGIHVYDVDGNLKATCNGADLQECVETGLPTPGAYVSRKITAFNANGDTLYSDIANAFPLAATPPAPTVSNRTATTVDVDVNPGTNDADQVIYSIYMEEGSTCDGVGGETLLFELYDWWSDADWGTFQVTGLSPDKAYVFCVKAQNGFNIETAYSDIGAYNAGYIPISGDFVYSTDTTGTNTFTNRYPDGYTDGRYVIAVDNAGTPNGAKFEVKSGILTINSTDTLATGELTLTGGSVAIAEGGQIKLGDPVWIVDADADGYSSDGKLYVGSQPTNGRRKTLAASLSASDCSDGYYSAANNCFTQATGGTITYSGNYKIHTFTSNGTFTVTATGSNPWVEYLSVGGGGGSGGGTLNVNYPAGGGGGRVLSGTVQVYVDSYAITIGAGGAYNGADAGTGGTGGTTNNLGNTAFGGSGGYHRGHGGASAIGYQGGIEDSGVCAAGGGGDAGAGENAQASRGGNGGIGTAVTITGSTIYVAGGGAGMCGVNGTNGLGGGNGNYGGGGGPAQAGGSGLAVLRYLYQ